jgi:hypothetical protein
MTAAIAVQAGLFKHGASSAGEPMWSDFMGVLEDLEDGGIIFLTKPDHAHHSDRITMEIGHDSL